jgi:hypothetical protein
MQSSQTLTGLSWAFLLITLVSIIGIYLATGRQYRVLGLWLGWAAGASGLALSGVLADAQALPPRMVWVILPATAVVVYLCKIIPVQRLNPAGLLALHLVRVPVELVLYQLYQNGLVPQAMTFAGWNFDILSGLGALGLLGYWWIGQTRPNRAVLWGFNAVGLVLLAIIVGTAALAVPSPLQQVGHDQPNVAILAFPYTLLPGVVVPVVLLAHLLAFKWLAQEKG